MEEAMRTVVRVLAETHWQSSLLAPEVISALPTIDPKDRGAQTVPVAIALAARELPAPPRGQAKREELLGVLLAAPRPRTAPQEHPLLVRVLVDLALGLARGESARTDDGFGRLAEIPGGLAAAAQKLRPDDLPAMLALLRAAREHPFGMLLYVSLATYMAVRLGGMLRTVWRASRTPRGRRAAAAIAAVLAIAFCLLFTFLFVSIFA